jgi:hypothetical protein
VRLKECTIGTKDKENCMAGLGSEEQTTVNDDPSATTYSIIHPLEADDERRRELSQRPRLTALRPYICEL